MTSGIPVQDPAPSLIDFRNITVIRGDKKALDGLTLSIAIGGHVAIVGPNGSGKSTLIKTIMRECYPLVRDDASLTIFGKDRWRLFDLRPLLGIVSPDWVQLCTRDITGREAILSGFFSSTEIWPHNKVTRPMEGENRGSARPARNRASGRTANIRNVDRRNPPDSDWPGSGSRSQSTHPRRTHRQPRPGAPCMSCER